MSFQGPDVNSSVPTSSSCSSAIGEAEKSSIEMEDLDDSEKKEKPSNKKNIVQLYKLFSLADSKDVALMIMGAGAAVVNGCSLPLTTLLFGNLINSFGGTAADIGYVLPKVSKVALDFLYLAVGAGVASFIQVVCWMTTGERQAARIRTLYLKSILRQEIAFFDRETNAGEVVGRMSGDTVLIQDAMGEKVGKFIQLLSSFIGGFIVAFIQGWHLTLVMLTTIPALVVAGAIMSTVVTKMASQGQQAYAETSVIVEQTVGSIRTVASFTGEKQMLSKYSESLKRAYSSSVKEGLAAGLGIGTVMCLLFCGYALGIWYGSKLILDKGYTGGKIITVIFAILTGSLSLGQASPCMSSFAAAQAATFKMFETINRKPEIDAYDTKGKRLNDIQGDIEFRDVCFSYPSRPNDQIFCRLSLFIQGGKSMALVGESGSGKSTVISLIERFYDPQGGEVLIDGVNLKEIQLRWIRGKIGLVSQEPILFSSTIRENIAYGKDDATIEEIRAAAELANASKFIDNMPQGMDTIVGEKGTQLSGGQKQRVAIARAILKDPRILLLDEATSALDAESEGVVQEALDRIMTGRTTVIVAHRLTTVRNTDTIIVLHNGSIIQKGTHSELLKDSDGVYSQLVRFQEMKRDSDRLNLHDQDRFITLLDVDRQTSQRVSFNQSISRGSSVGNSSRHSFSVSFGLPIGLDIQQRSMEEPTMSASSQASQVRIHRLAHLNKPEIPILTFGVIAAIVNGVILPLFGVLLANVIHTFYQPPQELRRDSRLWALMFVVIGALSLIALPARSYFFAVAGSQLIRRIRLMAFERVVSMEIAWFDDPENSSGAIGARLSTDAAAVRSLVGDALALAVQNTATLVAGLVIAFAANWQLSLIILALIPLIWLNGWIQIEFMKGFGADTKMMYEEASQVANDAVGCIRTVASFSAEDKVMELYKKKCDIPVKTALRQGLISGVGYGISFFLLYCVYSLSFYAGARLVQDGRTTFGRVFRVFFALLMAAIGVSQSSTVAPDSTKAKSAAASVLAILDRRSKVDPGDSSGMTLEDLKGNIEFKHVSFRYPTRPEVEVLQDFCLAIQSGKTVALIGESGSGKSTTISLLQRFYNPDSGHIMFDGIEIQRFRLGWLRQQMGLVSQEPVLFNDTIRANIAYGKEGKATEAEIIAAAELANAHKFVSSLQQGYNVLVGERGAQLSGGQKQRIAIARAIIKNPKILLLDEATNSLDCESACVVQEALDRVMLNRTTIVIAHQLSTIKGADLIAVVKNGVIIEKGKHEALINIKNGAYASLVALHYTQG